MSRRRAITFALFSVAVLLPGAAWAHVEPGTAEGLLSGFKHPIFGQDHLVAMIAVGLWGAQLGTPAVWLLPIAFPTVMAVGGLLGVVGVVLPVPDLFVAVSALVLGSAVALCLRAPIPAACLLVGTFAVFHGYAHGVGLQGAGNALGYVVGFVVATGLLHLVGITIGLLTRWPAGAVVVRVAGVAVAAVGLATLLAVAIAL